MKSYVLGFPFSRDKRDIVMIEKIKPDFMAGKLNGIGGKVESTDLYPILSMVREFKEETGVLTNPGKWELFATLRQDGEGNDKIILHCYRMFNDIVYECVTTESEEVKVVKVDAALTVEPIMKNLKWLIPMAIDQNIIISEIQANLSND